LRAQAAPGVEIENRDVFLVAEQLADEVELIREVMGRPYDDSPRLPVAGVSMAEVLFQAQTLLRKSNQLARELAGAVPVTVPPAPTGPIVAADILAILTPSLAQIRLVRSELAITEPVVARERDTDIAPTGLFSTIVDSNRQLNLLITNTITSADVFEELSVALAYAVGLLAVRAPGVTVAQAPFEGPKRPADVYTRLLECIDIAHRIARSQGVDVVSLSSRRNVPDDIEPGHVYDVANILVADLAVIAKAIEAPPADVDLDVAPKHIFPSHGYQRAGTVQLNLEALESAVVTPQ
jgi:hypothetical protein